MKKKAYLELFCYGIMSGFAALLFVFGTIYPEYIYTEDSYRVLTAEGFSEKELEKPVYELDKSKIKVSGKIYEGILKLLEDKDHDKGCISISLRNSDPEWGNGQNGNYNSWELL